MKTKRDIIMFYQTSLRNVGSFISVSLALLGISHFYRDKNDIYNVFFIIISLLFLLNSGIICLYLIQDIENFNKTEKKNDHFDKWIKIPRIIFGTIILIALFGLYSLKKQIYVLV